MTTVTSVPGLEKFVGSTARNQPTEKSLPILYNRNVEPAIRENFGISQGKSSVIYISPKILLSEFGRWQFTEEETKVTLLDKSYLVEKIHYLGWMYNTCIAVEFTLKSNIKGY